MTLKEYISKKEEEFDRQYRTSEIWEDAENNPNSTVHGIKSFVSQSLQGLAEIMEEERKEIEEKAWRYDELCK